METLTKETVEAAFKLIEAHPLQMKKWSGTFGGRVYHVEDDVIVATSPSVPDLETPECQARLWEELAQALGGLHWTATPCPHPARNGRHEVYVERGGRVHCRACGASAKNPRGQLP